jgi:hypothetical protein
MSFVKFFVFAMMIAFAFAQLPFELPAVPGLEVPSGLPLPAQGGSETTAAPDAAAAESRFMNRLGSSFNRLG